MLWLQVELERKSGITIKAFDNSGPGSQPGVAFKNSSGDNIGAYASDGSGGLIFNTEDTISALSLKSTGIFSISGQSSVRATRITTNQPIATNTTIIFNDDSTGQNRDTQDEYVNTTGIFTADEEGTYTVSCFLEFGNIVDVNIAVNGTNVNSGLHQSNSKNIVSFTDEIKLNSGDTLKLIANAATSANLLATRDSYLTIQKIA